jgi:uncharacterized cofD-like protein
MQEKSVVVIGGGPGTDIVLVGLKRYTSRLTALVSTFDANSRGSVLLEGNGAADHEGDDVRSSLLALGPDPATTRIMERLFAYRFAHAPHGNEMGASFGNLFLAALADITGGTDLALRAAARVLNVQGEVLPVTLEDRPLVAEMDDGTEVIVRTPSELSAAAAGVGVRHVRLQFPAQALDAAVHAIDHSDIIVLGPADLYFGLLAPLQLRGLSEAIMASDAVKILTCNLMTQANVTDGWPASRFIRAVMSHLGGQGSLDCVIINSAPMPSDLMEMRAAEGSFPVQFDLDECLSLGLNVIMRPVASSQALLHDPEKLARTILFLGGGRSARRTERRRLFSTGPLPEIAAHSPGALTHRGAES